MTLTILNSAGRACEFQIMLYVCSVESMNLQLFSTFRGQSSLEEIFQGAVFGQITGRQLHAYKHSVTTRHAQFTRQRDDTVLQLKIHQSQPNIYTLF